MPRAKQALLPCVLTFAVGCRSTDVSDGGVAPFTGPLRLVTLNIAQGAGDHYRTEANRSAQGELLARAAPHVVALQEVDLAVERSGDVDSTLDIARQLDTSTVQCTLGTSDFAIDGTAQCSSRYHHVLFGTGFRADDAFSTEATGQPSGIIDADDSLNPKGVDRGSDAYFGNALIVHAPFSVRGAYTVALPEAPDAGFPLALLEALGSVDSPTDEQRQALANHNHGVRARPGIEPRSALVARVAQSGQAPISIITTHLESAGGEGLRFAQLEALVALARAERGANGERRVVLLGDFNMTPVTSSPALTAAGFVLVNTLTEAGVAMIDQIWLDSSLSYDGGQAVPTEGVSDHRYVPAVTVR